MEVKRMRKNTKISDEGDWVDGLPGMGDLRLKVLGANSRVVRQALTEKINSDPINQKPENRARVTAEVYAETVLQDWENLVDDGNPVEFDRGLALTWLLDPEMDDFYNAVETASLRVANRAKEALEKIEGN